MKEKKKHTDENQPSLLAISNPFASLSVSQHSRGKKDIPKELFTILKKYQKKDATSRSKAFDELLSFAKTQSDPQEIAPLLDVLWSDFKIWTSDPERKVREEAINLLAFLIASHKKAIQTNFRQLAYPLLATLFDPVPSVSGTCKQNIFDRYFSEKGKLSALLQSAKPEILSQLKESVSLEKTFEETFYEPSEGRMMLERRIGCAFMVFSLVRREFQIDTLDLLGGLEGILHILQHERKENPQGSSYLKKSIYEIQYQSRH